MANIYFDDTYFKIAAYRNWREGDNFFNQYNLFSLIEQQKYYQVIFTGIEILSELQAFDQKAYSSIHKGTPFYWMGMASYLLHDFVTATYFFDAAVSEDIKNKEAKDLEKSPSILFALINDGVAGQAAGFLVNATRQRIEEFIDIYNEPKLNTNYLNLESIRDYLLSKSIHTIDHPWRNLSTSLISFFLEWNYRQILFNLRVQEGSLDSFFVHLFKGCLLFESLLKECPLKKPIKDNQVLSKVLNSLLPELNINRPNLKIGNVTLSNIINQLKNMPDEIAEYIEITGKLRNTLGHNLVWNVRIDSSEYSKLFKCVALSCLHAINMLYRI